MPCFNTEKYVGEALNSILAQTFKDFEFIIIDDGSTDNSAKIIESFHDEKIKFIKNTENLGIVAARNTGLDLAQGKYIAVMDADDVSHPDRLEKQVKYMDENPDCVICGSWIHFFPDAERKGKGRHKSEISFLDLIHGWCLNHPTIMFRNSDIRYDPSFPVSEDFDLYSRMIHFGKIHNIQEELLDYRWHGDNISTVKSKLMAEKTKIVQQRMLGFITDDEQIQSLLLYAEQNPIRIRKLSLFGIPLLKIERK